MDLNNITGVPVIAVLCYLIIEGIKIVAGRYEKVKQLLPIISAFLGALLGIVFFKFCPSIIPVSTYISALLIGILSGLSATGTNQIWKQVKNLLASKDDSEKGE